MTTTAPNTTKPFLETIAQFSRKATKFIFKAVTAAILAFLILAIVPPAGYFAWRAGQPMEAPQFKGLTFYQYMTWRIETHSKVATQYQATHPNVKVRLWICDAFDPVPFVVIAPWSEFYALAGKFPVLRRVINPRDYKYIPTDVAWETLPSAWWTTYEAMISPAISIDNRVTVYCRLPQYPPTPEEWAQTH